MGLERNPSPNDRVGRRWVGTNPPRMTRHAVRAWASCPLQLDNAPCPLHHMMKYITLQKGYVTMGSSLVHKIIESHLVSGTMKPGEEILLRVDQTLTHDINAVMTYLAFEALGLDRVRTRALGFQSRPQPALYRQQDADDHIYLQSAAKRFGVYVSRPGNGICHAIHTARFAVPGKVLFGGDSHTPHSVRWACSPSAWAAWMSRPPWPPAHAPCHAEGRAGLPDRLAQARGQRQGRHP